MYCLDIKDTVYYVGTLYFIPNPRLQHSLSFSQSVYHTASIFWLTACSASICRTGDSTEVNKHLWVTQCMQQRASILNYSACQHH